MRRGVALKAIGDVLGHRDPESTSVYLRLAVDDLREVGLPVPRGGAIVSLDPTGWRASLPRVRSARTTPLDSIDFHSSLSAALRRYLDTRRALGRRYVGEEIVLRHWDDFLQREFGPVRQVRHEMFHRWLKPAPTSPDRAPQPLAYGAQLSALSCPTAPQDLHSRFVDFPQTKPAPPPAVGLGPGNGVRPGYNQSVAHLASEPTAPPDRSVGLAPVVLLWFAPRRVVALAMAALRSPAKPPPDRRHQVPQIPFGAVFQIRGPGVGKVSGLASSARVGDPNEGLPDLEQ